MDPIMDVVVINMCWPRTDQLYIVCCTDVHNHCILFSISSTGYMGMTKQETNQKEKGIIYTCKLISWYGDYNILMPGMIFISIKYGNNTQTG
jgi:hypothetical protein